jgi:hypothetical protein
VPSKLRARADRNRRARLDNRTPADLIIHANGISIDLFRGEKLSARLVFVASIERSNSSRFVTRENLAHVISRGSRGGPRNSAASQLPERKLRIRSSALSARSVIPQFVNSEEGGTHSRDIPIYSVICSGTFNFPSVISFLAGDSVPSVFANISG